MQAPLVEPVPGKGLPYKWIVAIVVIFGAFMSVLDQTIVNIAIPRLQNAFGADLNSVQWVLTAYILTQGVVTPTTGFLAERVGTKRSYIIALAIFTAGSALCGLAWNLPILIVFRILQGIGGAFLFPLSITLLYREFPPQQRGLASGIFGIAALLAPAVGPTLGGYFVTYADWPLIFFVNVPVGILAVILGILLLREIPSERRVSFDLPGFALAAGGLTALLYALSDVSTDGWSSAKVVGLLIAGFLILCLFVVVELRIARRGGQPLVDLRLFANGPFLSSNVTNALMTFAFFGGLFIFPIYLQNLRSLNAFQAGLLLLPQAFASIVAALVGGRLVDRIGVRPVILPGLLILAFATWQLTSLTLDTTYSWLQVLFFLRGLALGLIIQPLTVSALAEIQPRQFAQASSLNTVVRFVSTSLGIAVLATLVQTQNKVHFNHLRDQMTSTSSTAQLLARLQASFMARGIAMQKARAMGLQIIVGQIRRLSYMLALQDAFWVILLVILLAFASAFFIRSRVQARTVKKDAPADPEREAALLEASLG